MDGTLRRKRRVSPLLELQMVRKVWGGSWLLKVLLELSGDVSEGVSSVLWDETVYISAKCLEIY